MTINHGRIEITDDGPFVFAELGGFTCSVCAPDSWTAAEIEAWVGERYPPAGSWRSVDKSQLGIGTPTPNPCNTMPQQRKHWFMMREKTWQTLNTSR